MSDAELVQRVRGGDAAAFRTLVERHERLVWHVAARVVAGAADREDVAQEAFLRVYRGLAGFRGEAKLSTWIARVAYHTALHHAEKRRPEPFAQAGGDPAETLAADAALPDEAAAVGARDRTLRAAVEGLPPPYRVVLTLFHLDGFSHAEVAEALGMPLGTVKNYLFRARQKLKDALLAAHPAEEWR